MPRAAAGDTVTVELVAWTAPIPVGVAAAAPGGPVPNAVAAGAGPSIGVVAMSGAGDASRPMGVAVAAGIVMVGLAAARLRRRAG